MDTNSAVLKMQGSLLTLTPEIVVGALAFGVFGWSVGGADPWNDELVTLIVASWPISAIMKLAEHQDLVHVVYYLLVHPLVIVNHSIVAVRLVSVVAMAVSAVVLVRVGRALDGWPVGLGAGLMLIVSATASRYAQEARPYALVVLLATLTTLGLIRAIETPFATRRWAIYSALLVATGLVNILGTLIVLAHAVWVSRVSVARRTSVILRWCVFTGLAGAVLAPFVIFSLGQVGQVGKIPRLPVLTELADTAESAWPSLDGGPPAWEVGLFTLITVVVVGLWGRPGARSALVLGLAWGLIPPLALSVVSQIHPLYRAHYVLVAVPGIALALGSLAGLRFTRRSSRGAGDADPNMMVPTLGSAPGQAMRAAVAVMVILIPAVALALAGLPHQRAQRLPDGHGENFRRIAQILATESRSGDGIVSLPFWYVTDLKTEFPLPDGVDDFTLDRAGPSTASITGWQVTPHQAVEHLARHCRVWVITRFDSENLADWEITDTDSAVVNELSTGYYRVEKQSVGFFDILQFFSRKASCSFAV